MEPLDLVEAYRSHMTMARRHRPRTIFLFCQHIGAFLKSGHPIDAAGIKAYLMTLGKLCAASVCNRLTALKSFSKWLFGEGLISELERARIRDLQGPVVPKRLPKPLTHEQIVKMIEAPAPALPQRGMRRAVFEAREIRDSAIVELFYATGFRCSELCSLDMGSCVKVTLPTDSPKGKGKMKKRPFTLTKPRAGKKRGRPPLPRQELMAFRVIGKGDRERLGFVGKKAIAALEAYLAVREQLWERQPLHPTALFVGIRSGARLSPHEARKIIKRRGKRIGARWAHPHAIRHGFATELNAKEAPMPLIQKLMGHLHIASTQIYITMLDPEVARGFKKFFPRS